MKLQIESTTKIVVLRTNDGDVPARIWEGQTDTGIRVHCYITRVAVAKDANHEQFEKELQECRPPSAEVAAIDARLILCIKGVAAFAASGFNERSASCNAPFVTGH